MIGIKHCPTITLCVCVSGSSNKCLSLWQNASPFEVPERGYDSRCTALGKCDHWHSLIILAAELLAGAWIAWGPTSNSIQQKKSCHLSRWRKKNENDWKQADAPWADGAGPWIRASPSKALTLHHQRNRRSQTTAQRRISPFWCKNWLALGYNAINCRCKESKMKCVPKFTTTSRQLGSRTNICKQWVPNSAPSEPAAKWFWANPCYKHDQRKLNTFPISPHLRPKKQFSIYNTNIYEQKIVYHYWYISMYYKKQYIKILVLNMLWIL